MVIWTYEVAFLLGYPIDRTFTSSVHLMVLSTPLSHSSSPTVFPVLRLCSHLTHNVSKNFEMSPSQQIALCTRLFSPTLTTCLITGASTFLFYHTTDLPTCLSDASLVTLDPAPVNCCLLSCASLAPFERCFDWISRAGR